MNYTKTGLIFLMLILIITTAMAAPPEITQLTYTPSPAIPGTTITVLIQLQSNDSTTQKGVTLKIEDTYPFTVKATDNEQNPRNIGDMEKFSKALATYTIYVDPTAENKTYSLPIVISTKDDAIGKKSLQTIVINGKEPTIKVVDIKYDPIHAGEDKEVTFVLQNVGTSTAYDLIAEIQEDRTVTATGTVVEREITAMGAATAYVSSIAPGERKEAKITLSISSTAEIKNYTLPVKVSFRNAAGTRTTDTSYTGINVTGQANIDATIKEKTGGLRGDLTIEIFNKGAGKAQFLTIEVQTQNGVIEKPKQFIGTLGPNDVDTIKTPITLESLNGNSVQVSIEYQDSDATTKKTVITLPINVQQTADQGINPILIIVIVVIVAFLIWNFGFKKKRK